MIAVSTDYSLEAPPPGLEFPNREIWKIHAVQLSITLKAYKLKKKR